MEIDTEKVSDVVHDEVKRQFGDCPDSNDGMSSFCYDVAAAITTALLDD